MNWPIRVSWDPPLFVRRLFAPLVRPVVVGGLRLRNLIETEDGEPDALMMVLEFGESETDLADPEPVDANELQSSLEGDGTFFIWTCSCGVPGCAGLFHGVEVRHAGGTTRWHDLDRQRRFVLNTKDLRDAYERAIVDGRDLLRRRPGLGFSPEGNVSVFRAMDDLAREP